MQENLIQFPNEILRKIYEEAHLAGDVMNKNQENLIHNYMNEYEH